MNEFVSETPHWPCENDDDALFAVDPDWRFLLVDDPLCERLGYRRKDLLGRTLDEITHPDDLYADVHQFMDLAMEKIRRYRVAKRFKKGDGSWQWATLSVSIHRADHNGGKVSLICSLTTDAGRG